MGMWASLALSLFARGVSEQLAKDAVNQLTGHIQLHAKDYVNDPVVDHRFEADLSAVKSAAGIPVLATSSRVRVPAVILSERNSLPVTFVGISPEDEKGLSFIGQGVSIGKMLSGVEASEIVVGKKLLELLETKLNRRVVVMSQDVSGEVVDRGFTVVGVFDAELETSETQYVFANKVTVQKMLSLGGGISEVSLLFEDRTAVTDVLPRIRGAYKELDVQSWLTLEPLVSAILQVQDKFIRFWFLIVVVAVAFGLINTLFMAIFERAKEIGLFQALGMRPRLIVFQVLIESIVLLVVGMTIGNLAAFGTQILLSGGIDLASFAEGTQTMGFSSVIYPTIRIRDWVHANTMIFTIGVLASIYPAWKGTRAIPIEAIARGA